jgi:hypothetical protein
MSKQKPLAPQDPTRFSKFIASMVFLLLERRPSQLINSQKPIKEETVNPSGYPSPIEKVKPDIIELSYELIHYGPQLLHYIHSILKCTAQSISLSVVVLALFYISQIHQYKVKTPALGSEAHLFCICLMLAQKNLDDHAFRNKTWSKITRIPVQLLTQMERECLACLKFDLFLSKEAFEAWHQHVQAKALFWNAGFSTRKSQFYVAPPDVYSITKKQENRTISSHPSPMKRSSSLSSTPHLKKARSIDSLYVKPATSVYSL